MKSYAVIGAGFGDEGKGLVVNWLCQNAKKPLVVRYCGGHQAGHQVVTENGHHHIFSNFGSGTLSGAPTYWSKYCTVDPVGLINEFEELTCKGVDPLIYLDSQCLVTTPFDINYGRQQARDTNHGSCGLGVNATYRREDAHFSFTIEDVFNPIIYKIKLQLVAAYYKNVVVSPEEIDMFNAACNIMRHKINFVISYGMPMFRKEIIFEGSQGLLLDQNFGFFPHVTPSNTGTKNILEMGFKPEILLVARAYQTRHGNGPMTNEDLPHNIKENAHEKNTTHEYQGEFRKALLDINLLEYAIAKDDYIREKKNKILVMTCLDLIKEEYRFTVDGDLLYLKNEDEFLRMISKILKIKNIFVSHSPVSKYIKRYM